MPMACLCASPATWATSKPVPGCLAATAALQPLHPRISAPKPGYSSAWHSCGEKGKLKPGCPDPAPSPRPRLEEKKKNNEMGLLLPDLAQHYQAEAAAEASQAEHELELCRNSCHSFLPGVPSPDYFTHGVAVASVSTPHTPRSLALGGDIELEEDDVAVLYLVRLALLPVLPSRLHGCKGGRGARCEAGGPAPPPGWSRTTRANGF